MSTEHLLGFLQRFLGLAHALRYGERVALDEIMHAMQEIGHAQALEPLCRKVDEGFGPITDQVPDTGSEGLEPRLHQRFPRGAGPILGHLCQQQIPCGEVHEDQQHPFHERFVHRANDLAHLIPRAAVLFPGLRCLQQCGLQRLHHAAQGRGRTPRLRLKVQTRKKLARRVHPHAALEPKDIECGDHKPSQPLPALLGFPSPGLRMAVAALHRLSQTMHTAFGQPSLLSQLAHAWGGIITKALENPQAFVPKSHVGRFSEESLNSWWNSGLQRTRPTPNCPTLSGYSLVAACWGLGLVSLCQGNLSRSLSLLERALSICQEVDTPIFFPRVAAALGTAYTLGRRIADARPLLTQAIEQTIATETIGEQALCSLPLGETHLLPGHLEEAHNLAERTLALTRKHQERGNEAYAPRLLGDIATRREPLDIKPAESHYQHALALARELGMRPLQAHCHRGLGTLYCQTGRDALARAALSTAIEMYRAMEMTFWLPQTEAALAQEK
jgi:tetratricopeptide (TPR) repeat protein